MNKYIICFLVFACFSIHGFSQNPQPEIYLMKGENAQHYINNEIYYTMKFAGNDVTYLEDGSFKIQDHIIRLIESDYDTSLYHNGKSIEAEKKVLEAFKDEQIGHLQKMTKDKVKVKEDYFSNKEGKLFYLFSANIPSDKVNLEEDYLKKMNILCFVVNDKLSTISFPLFKSENEDEKTTYIKAIAESVDIFPSKMSIDFLKRRVLNTDDEDLVENYENAHFKFTVPDYLNVLKSNDKNMWAASFPDVNNVKNAVVIRIIKKEEYDSFEAFNKEVLPQGKLGDQDDRMKLLLKEELENVGQINGKSLRFQYMPKGTVRLYHAKKVTFQTKSHYGLVFFNATAATYAGNIDRFDAFLKGLEILD
jgi:hypothetical protein